MSRTTGRGRRPGSPDTREDILTAARTHFAHKGFDRTTMRGVAAEAGVDPALVHHYFGAKDDLFLVALELPFDPRELVPTLFSDDIEHAGERLARTFLGYWEDPATRMPLLALLRSALTSEEGAELLERGMVRLLLSAVERLLEAPDSTLRAELVGSQLIGFAVGRYVLQLEPLASASPEELVAWLAPNLQRYITGSIDSPP